MAKFGIKKTGSATEKAMFDFAKGFSGQDKAEGTGEADKSTETPASPPPIVTETEKQDTQVVEVKGVTGNII